MTSTLSGYFRCRATPLRVPFRRFPPEIRALKPSSLAAPKRVSASTSQRRWLADLAVTECRIDPRPCGSGSLRPSSSTVAVDEAWSPGDLQSLVGSSGRPDRGPGGHLCESGLHRVSWSGFLHLSRVRSGFHPSGFSANLSICLPAFGLRLRPGHPVARATNKKLRPRSSAVK